MSSPTPQKLMSFSEIITPLLSGKRLRRNDWPITVAIFMQNDRLMIQNEDGGLHVLIVSTGDLIGKDWVLELVN